MTWLTLTFSCVQAEVTAFAEECSKDLEAAEPIIKEAEAALNSLDKGSLGELKSFGSPAAEVVQVVSACIVLTAPGGKIPKVSARLMSMKLACATTTFCQLLSVQAIPVSMQHVLQISRCYCCT